MNIFVCVKQVMDTTMPLRVVDGHVLQVTPAPVLHLGTADRAALEGALSLREHAGGRVAAISAGLEDAIDALRFCLARGVDRAIHVQCESGLDPVASALAAASALAQMTPDVVLCGRRSDDGASGHFPGALAAGLGWPLVTRVAALTLEAPLSMRVERRVERGDREIIRCPLPAVLAVEVGLVEPRYVSVRARRQAAALPIERLTSPASPPSPIQLIALEAAKPRPRRVSAPAAGLPPMDRLAHLLAGGVKQKASDNFVEGAPDSAAAEIVRFLQQRGFVHTREQ